MTDPGAPTPDAAVSDGPTPHAATSDGPTSDTATRGAVVPGAHAPVVLVSSWRRRGQVWGPWERDVTGAEHSYLAPLIRAGLAPVLVPIGSAAARTALLDVADGLVVIGGEDVHPDVSGDRTATVGDGADADRDRWEIGLLSGALDRHLPVLAICRGMQLLAVARGGTLDPEISGTSAAHPVVPGDLPEALAYRHEVTLEPDSLLAEIYGATGRQVNSLHHQAVATPGRGLVVTARSADGRIEAIGLDRGPGGLGGSGGPGGSDDGGDKGDGWCAAMQWHPELMGDDPHENALFTEFARRCAT